MKYRLLGAEIRKTPVGNWQVVFRLDHPSLALGSVLGLDRHFANLLPGEMLAERVGVYELTYDVPAGVSDTEAFVLGAELIKLAVPAIMEAMVGLS